MSKGNEYLKPIFKSKKFFIEACDGSKGLSDPMHPLFDWKDPAVDSLATKIPTGRTRVEAYEILQRVNFMRLFISLEGDGAGLFFTPHQVREFIANNATWLKEGECDTYLFFKGNSGIFGAYPLFASLDRTQVYFIEPEQRPLCPGSKMPRLVVPCAR